MSLKTLLTQLSMKMFIILTMMTDEDGRVHPRDHEKISRSTVYRTIGNHEANENSRDASDSIIYQAIFNHVQVQHTYDYYILTQYGKNLRNVFLNMKDNAFFTYIMHTKRSDSRVKMFEIYNRLKNLYNDTIFSEMIVKNEFEQRFTTSYSAWIKKQLKLKFLEIDTSKSPNEPVRVLKITDMVLECIEYLTKAFELKNSDSFITSIRNLFASDDDLAVIGIVDNVSYKFTMSTDGLYNTIDSLHLQANACIVGGTVERFCLSNDLGSCNYIIMEYESMILFLFYHGIEYTYIMGFKRTSTFLEGVTMLSHNPSRTSLKIVDYDGNALDPLSITAHALGCYTLDETDIGTLTTIIYESANRLMRLAFNLDEKIKRLIMQCDHNVAVIYHMDNEIIENMRGNLIIRDAKKSEDVQDILLNRMNVLLRETKYKTPITLQDILDGWNVPDEILKSNSHLQVLMNMHTNAIKKLEEYKNGLHTYIHKTKLIANRLDNHFYA